MNNISMINLSEGNDKKYTSRQIAEWTCKDHKNVLRDIESEIENLGEIGKLIFELSSYKLDTNSKPYKMYEMDKDGVMQIAARYDAVVRYKLIQKLKELELQPVLPQNYLEALKALVESEEGKQLLLTENEDLKIKLNDSEKYYTIMKLNQIYNLKWDMKQCQARGKKATFFCKIHGYEIRKCKTNDERFSEVNSYPIEALERLFL